MMEDERDDALFVLAESRTRAASSLGVTGKLAIS